MALIIGTDEAGYGPNLGPLLITATAWRVPDEHAGGNLYELLCEGVTRETTDGDARLAIADSKLLYKPRGPLTLLERAVLSALAIRESPFNYRQSWRELWKSLDPNCGQSLEALPWDTRYDEPLPVAVQIDDVQSCVEALSIILQQQDVELVDVRMRAIFPGEFNGRVRKCGSKGALLTEATLQLVADVVSNVTAGYRQPVLRGNGAATATAREPIHVVCDKHGGRNRYAAALQHIWPDSWVDIVAESRPKSVYRLNLAGANAEFQFQTDGEARLPSALASMVSKFLRELAMRALNAFWQSHLPNLRPTAGYPTDAKRFKADIEAKRRELGIAEDLLWRCR